MSENEPLTNQSQLTLAEINASANNNRARLRVAALTVVAVAAIILSLIFVSYDLVASNREVPPFVSTTITVLTTGLVGILAFDAGQKAK
ncbi:MAG: hypothetical protein ACRDBH_04995 [Bosea sp. (in: a-proteobacteria)]